MLLIFALLFSSPGPNSVEACDISINQDLINPQVLILDNSGHFIFPQHGDVISIEQGTAIEVNCAGRTLRIDRACTQSEFANATCTKNNYFDVNDQAIRFSSLNCSQFPRHTARLTGNYCSGKNFEFEIGFVVHGKFLRLLDGCFDPIYQNTLYTKMNLNYMNRGRQVNVARPSWIETDVHNLGGISLNYLYRRDTQRKTINNLLGLPENSTTWIHDTSNFYLARGHLAAMADYIFGNHQRATFYFLNAAPKWQMFNGGNWNTLEANIRNFVIRNHLNVTVYTGTYGVSTLKHSKTGEDVELYLFADDEGNKAIPVPKIFWKVIYEPISKRGTVFLGVNNPYLEQEEVKDYQICPNVCSKIPWLTWRPNVLTNGYVFCCDVEEFRKVVDTLPPLPINSLLK